MVCSPRSVGQSTVDVSSLAQCKHLHSLALLNNGEDVMAVEGLEQLHALQHLRLAARVSRLPRAQRPRSAGKVCFDGFWPRRV